MGQHSGTGQFVGYQKGLRSITQEDLERQRFDREMAEYDETVKEAKNLHAKRIADWEEDLKRREALKQKLHDLHHEELLRAENLRQTEHNLKLKAIEDRHAAHEESVERWRAHLEAMTSAHSEGMSDRLARSEEFESYQKLPDFQALCKCVSLIGSLDLQLEELKRSSDNESISRGMGRRAAV